MSIPPPPEPQQPQQPERPQYPQYPQYPSPQAHSPYGPLPYQPWTQGYTPFTFSAPVNGLAIGALVLGILCCLPGVGLVLGLVALSQIRRRGERGRGMAIAGSVLSSIGIAVWVAMIATGGAADFWEGFKDGARHGIGAAPAKGECFNTSGGSLTEDTYDFDTVPCEHEHDAEVFGSFRLTGRSYPGEDAVADTGEKRCYGLVGGYAMDTWALPDDVDIYYSIPDEDSWSMGDREVVCVFGDTDERRVLTGSLRNDETVLDADQVAYLKAAQAIDVAMDAAPDAEYADEDLPGYKAWSGRVAKTLGAQARTLRGHHWPAAVKQPMADMTAELDKARAEWTKAATAKDADTFYPHFDKGLRMLDRDKTVTARKALGLDTTPPSDGVGSGVYGGGEDGGGMEV